VAAKVIVANQTYGKASVNRSCTEPCCSFVLWQNVAQWKQFYWTDITINLHGYELW